MSGFVYFLPGRQKIQPADLEQLGLGYLFDEAERSDPRITQRQATRGPDDQGAGVVLGVGAGSGAVGYWPDAQRWQPMHAAGTEDQAVYVGFQPDDPPTPDELARREQIGGHSIRLNDGREWLIPVAFAQAREDALPRVHRLGPGGQLVQDPDERYRRLSEFGERVFQQFQRDAAAQGSEAAETAGEHEAVTETDAFWIAVEALTCNYRIGADEVSALGLLGSYRYWTVISPAELEGNPDRTSEFGVLAALIDLPVSLVVARDLAGKEDADTPDG